MKRRIIVLALLLSIFMGLSLNVQAATLYDEIEKPAIGGKYYLCATVDGTDYYYQAPGGGQSVTDTAPYSLYVTSDPDEKQIKEFTLEALGGGFAMGYPSGDKTHRIYSFDVGNDDSVDTGTNSGLDIDRHCFYWDGEKQQIFSMKDDEKYVLVVKTIRSIKTANDELHMLSVPAAELEGEEPVYPVRFVVKHECVFSQEWTSNDYSHWYPCNCGAKKDLQLHQVESWTVTKEAAVGEEGSRTGTCSTCGATAVEAISALKDKNAATEPVEDTQDQQETPVMLNPVILAVAAALAVGGVVILIWGKKREKKQ